MAETTERRIHGFDYLRGIGAIMIMLYHYTTRYEFSFGHLGKYDFYAPWGGTVGISIFFVLSGALIVMHIKEDDNLLNFGYRRMIRLYPAYWAAIAVTSVTTHLFLPERSLGLREILINLTMLQSFLGVSNVDGAYWTLQQEILFYFIIGILVQVKQKKNILWACYVWLAAAFALQMAAKRYDNALLSILNILLITQYAHMFIAGIAIGTMKRDKRSYPILLLCAAYEFMTFGLVYGLLFAVELGMICWMAGGVRMKLPLSKPILFIGSISYPLYLIHQYLGFGIIRNMEQSGLTNELFLMVPAAVSILAAYLIHRFVETPSRKQLLNLYNRLAGRLKQQKKAAEAPTQ